MALLLIDGRDLHRCGRLAAAAAELRSGSERSAGGLSLATSALANCTMERMTDPCSRQRRYTHVSTHRQPQHLTKPHEKPNVSSPLPTVTSRPDNKIKGRTTRAAPHAAAKRRPRRACAAIAPPPHQQRQRLGVRRACRPQHAREATLLQLHRPTSASRALPGRGARRRRLVARRAAALPAHRSVRRCPRADAAPLLVLPSSNPHTHFQSA